jgi:hypothetical protein
MNRIPSPIRDEPHAGLGASGEDREQALRPDPPHEDEDDDVLRVDPDRERLHSGNQNIDPFDISDIYAKYAPTRGDPKRGNIDNEIDFNWKRYETYGKPDYAEQRAYHAQGWRPVMHHHFPGRFSPPGTQGAVIVKDMILMERPMRLTVKARNEEIHEATRAMQVNRQKVEATPDGSMPRVVYANRTSREAIEIPE